MAAATANVSKEDIQRAGSILKSIIGDLERPPQELNDVLSDEERQSLHELRKMLDVMENPLLGAVADITETCKKTVADSKQWNKAAEVKTTTTTDDVVTEFKSRYKISRSLLEDIDIILSPSKGGAPGGHEPNQTTAGPDLNSHQLELRSPSLSSCESSSSAGSRRKRGKKKDKGLTLAHLARDPTSSPSSPGPGTSEIQLKPLRPSSPPPPPSSLPPPPPPSLPPLTLPPRGELQALNQRNVSIRDVSLSSLSSDASAPPLPPSLPPPDEDSVFSISPPSSPTANEDEVGGQHPKDLLFLMRDKKSMDDVRTTLNGRWGRGPREIELPLSLAPSDNSSIGIELCGLSETGVFISNVTSTVLKEVVQTGDQVLQVDSHPVDNMAWFEVMHLIVSSKPHPPEEGHTESHKGNGVGREEEEQCENEEEKKKTTDKESFETNLKTRKISLLVQFNPAGLGEAKRRTNLQKR